MYTNGSGERRIRVINYKFDISSRLEVVYDSLDYLTLANVNHALGRSSQRLIRAGCSNPTQLRPGKMRSLGWVP